MRLIDTCLGEAAIDAASLGGVLVLSGPGSFTGLRVGMAVAMGLHQALGLAAGTVSTFAVLAQHAPRRDRPVHAAVRALRTDWYVQSFDRPGGAAHRPQRLVDRELLEVEGSQIVAFGFEALLEGQDLPAASSWSTPGALAEAALCLAELADWDARSLTRPAYLAPPPVHRRPATRPST